MAIEATHEGGNQIRYVPLGHAPITVSTVAVGLPSLPNRKRVRRATITTKNQPICWRDDGVDPTASSGGYLSAGSTLVYDGDMELFKMILDSGATGDADVRVAYHGV
jgi:hypothetical protein